MNTIKVENRNEIPSNAKVNQIFSVSGEFLNWKVCRNWCGTVFATQLNSRNEVLEDGEEIVLRQDW